VFSRNLNLNSFNAVACNNADAVLLHYFIADAALFGIF
jgi:hypothetical protein